MKFETKFKKILEMQDSQLKASKLTNLGLKSFSGSLQQKRVMAELKKLIKKGYHY